MDRTCAKILKVEEGSPAFDAGFEPGCAITSVNGNPLRDMVDWLWDSADDEIELEYVDLDGEQGTITLERDPGEDWGITFDGAVFDGVKVCKNSCTFCFMRQLPKDMRKSLSVRDDDFRLSFLEGTFCTFTNTDDSDIARIIEQHISPLRISLHAIDPEVRKRIIGKNEARGIAVLEQLMESGIEFDAQIVLVPGENDGEVLDSTLEWAYSMPRINNVGIVPLGFTKFQDRFSRSFDAPEDALGVLEQVKPFQKRALSERGTPWVYAADEFYCNAYGKDVLSHIPSDDFYGDFSMFEDGIGIVRSAMDSWDAATSCGLTAEVAKALSAQDIQAFYLCGEAMKDYANELVGKTDLLTCFEFRFVRNRFFGGNVNVTGLLCGCDLSFAIKEIASHEFQEPRKGVLAMIPEVVFNDDGLTLDGWTLDEIKEHVGEVSGLDILVAASNPLDYMAQIRDFLSSEIDRLSDFEDLR